LAREAAGKYASSKEAAEGLQRFMNSSLDIYTAHFGLAERPFSLVPDPEFIYWSPAHRRAFAILEYGVLTRAPITLITGGVGTGKTTLLHHMIRSVGQDVRLGLVSNAHGDRGELLRWVLLALAQPAGPQETYVDLFGRFQQYLIAEYAAGRRVILIFDEAQNLSRESLEELRMFTNINSGKDELLQLVLVGQPELRDIVRRPDLTQFAQRVAAAFHLEAMDRPTLHAYVHHRLKVAGGAADLFSPSAIDTIHDRTGGIPRLVNQLCDFSMVYAYTKDEMQVTDATVQQVLDDGVFFAALPAGRLPPLFLTNRAEKVD
jgi:general secretion pathway protein A